MPNKIGRVVMIMLKVLISGFVIESTKILKTFPILKNSATKVNLSINAFSTDFQYGIVYSLKSASHSTLKHVKSFPESIIVRFLANNTGCRTMA